MTSVLPTRTPIPTFTPTAAVIIFATETNTLLSSKMLPTATPVPTLAAPVPIATPSLPTDTPIPTPIALEPISSPSEQLQPDLPLQEAQVINVVDGDTINVLINGAEFRVRYILVDTPETKHPDKGVEPFGPEADQANRQLVEGKVVHLEKDVSETDRYGRLLRYVYVDGKMVNEELLCLGLAQVATFPPDVRAVR